MNKKTLKKILCAFLCIISMLLSACGNNSEEEFVYVPEDKSDLRPVDSLYIDVEESGSYEDNGTKEAVQSSYNSPDGLCTILVYPDYFDVTLDYEKGSPKEVGKSYAKAIRQVYPEYEKIVEPYVYENIKAAFPGVKDDYFAIEDRLTVLFSSLPAEYQEELEGFSHEFSGGRHGFVLDGKVSYEEILIMQMVPDALRPTSCSALSLWGDKTVSGRMMTLRVLEWNLGSENQMGKISAVTHMKNGDKSITAIGILGLIDIITAINDDGVFVGILDVGSLEEETFVCEGKKCYTYAIRYALENFDNATDVGNYMVENSGDFTWCHNLIISDKDNAYCAEDCVSEVSKKGQGYSVLRDANTPLHKELKWDNKDSLCVVNSFTSRNNQDTFTAVGSNLVRFNKYNTWVGAKDKFSPADVKNMITCEQTKSDKVQNVHGRGTVHIALVDYSTHAIQVAFTGVDGVLDKPLFIDVGTY